MLKALVVEDEEDIKQLLVDELDDKGYDVQEAGNGVIAIQRVREQIPDIIFIDVMLPVMDGFTLISKLREGRDTARIPVVLVTALNARDTEVRAGKLGVKHHLTKPWEPWALDFVLEQALKPDCKWDTEKAKYQVYRPKPALAIPIPPASGIGMAKAPVGDALALDLKPALTQSHVPGVGCPPSPNY